MVKTDCIDIARILQAGPNSVTDSLPIVNLRIRQLNDVPAVLPQPQSSSSISLPRLTSRVKFCPVRFEHETIANQKINPE